MRSLKSKGVTLIELIIAVAIVGIMAAIAVPNCIEYQDRQRGIVPPMPKEQQECIDSGGKWITNYDRRMNIIGYSCIPNSLPAEK